MADSKNTFVSYQQAPQPVVQTIFDVSGIALGQLLQFIEENPPRIPVSQLTGYSQNIATSSFILTSETTGSGTYVNLATTGPSVSALPNGQYLLLYGAYAKNSAGSVSIMAPSVDGATPSDNDAAAVSGTNQVSIMRATAVTLTGNVVGGHTITAQYRVTGGTGTWERRWMVSLRFANA